jgi:adenine-specific DNA-methyltransferase
MVAITPRSFCNGSYFQSFRELFLKQMELRRLHVFESRKQAFRDDDILQENVILQAVKKGKKNPRNVVNIENSIGPNEPPRSRKVAYSEVIHPGDRHFFIHIAGDEKSDQAAEQIRSLNTTLADLSLTVSTGRVVDFRAKKYLRTESGDGTVPLIWPTHFENGYIRWPKLGSKKPQAIRIDKRIEDQLVPNEPYVLVRRFSAKEERRRVFAAIYDPTRLKTPFIGFENHLNYFHQRGRGLDITLARGLAAYLNSTAVDMYVRRFNGHTQVNATDLRTLHYPTIEQLWALGRRIPDAFPVQEHLDVMVMEELEFAT